MKNYTKTSKDINYLFEYIQTEMIEKLYDLDIKIILEKVIH